MTILRYPKNLMLISGQDPFLDMLNWLGFLCAKDYLAQLLQRVHGFSARDARARAALIIPHVHIAISFIRQCLDGPPDISFLPAYYAILNLMKVYVLLGPRHADLPKHRWHGVTYDVHGKDSQSVLTEIITLKKDGVFPLDYQTITGKILTPNEVKLQMKDVLPYVSAVTYEYELATGSKALLGYLDLDYVSKRNGLHPQISFARYSGGRRIPKNQLKVLREFRSQRNQPNVFLGKCITDPSKKDEETRAQMNTHLIYRIYPELAVTPISSKKIELPEELPIALMFFYMSSIVRYKPEFFDRLQNSKFWPLLSSARIHSFNAFLLAFWSFMHQENCFVE